MMFLLHIFLFFAESTDRVEVFAPELVISENALRFNVDFGHYGIDIIRCEASENWYSFLFVGVSTNQDVSGVVFGSNPYENKDTDMLARPIPFSYTTNDNGKARGWIYFRNSLRKLCVTPQGKETLCAQ